MNAKTRIHIDLSTLLTAPMPAAHAVALPTPQPVTLHLDVSAVDRLSCALSELRIVAPHLSAAGFAALTAWAQKLCARITYLLEQIGPIELDPNAGNVLIRSDPPDRQSAGAHYYEILLQNEGAGHFTLRRYSTQKGSPGRTPVDLYLTHEVLDKLVNDLVDSLP